MQIKQVLSVSLGVLTVSAFMTTTTYAAGTILVDDSDPTSDASGCGTAANKCNTVQKGVDVAVVGDIVQVAAGTYNERVTVNKTLRILGAQAGVDARTRSTSPAQESVMVNSGGAFILNANSIEVNGFTMQDATGDAAVLTSNAFSGYKLLNNIVQNNVRGYGLNTSGTLRTYVQRNRIVNNSNPNGSYHRGNGIDSDTGLRNAQIDNNRFGGHLNADFSTHPTAQHSNITFEDNVSVASLVAINIYNTRNSVFDENTISGTYSPQDDFSHGGIEINGGNRDIEIEDNTIRDRSKSGILLMPFSGTNLSGISIHDNLIRNVGRHGIEVMSGSVVAGGVHIEDNDIYNNGLDGIRINSGISGLLIEENEMFGNGEHDAHDFSTGSGTTGTANTWDDNDCNTSSPAGLCSA